MTDNVVDLFGNEVESAPEALHDYEFSIVGVDEVIRAKGLLSFNHVFAGVVDRDNHLVFGAPLTTIRYMRKIEVEGAPF